MLGRFNPGPCADSRCAACRYSVHSHGRRSPQASPRSGSKPDHGCVHYFNYRGRLPRRGTDTSLRRCQIRFIVQSLAICFWQPRLLCSQSPCGWSNQLVCRTLGQWRPTHSQSTATFTNRPRFLSKTAAHRSPESLIHCLSHHSIPSGTVPPSIRSTTNHPGCRQCRSVRLPALRRS